jgi:hypothetical protein
LLACASCDQSSAPPQSAGLGGFGGILPVSFQESNNYLLRWITVDGSRVFFDSTEPLVPQDTNGLMDVYAWERNGDGSCPVAGAGQSEDGCVYLLSGGQSTVNDGLVDADVTGDNVFFTSNGRLVPQARDENVALYDVRVDGGFPESSLACTGTGCQGVPPAPPIFATPSSVTFDGVGNFTAPGKPEVKSKSKPAKCKRGFARKRGKCQRVSKTKKEPKRSKVSQKAKKSGVHTMNGRQG